MRKGTAVSLRDHFDALRRSDKQLRKADQRAIKIDRRWTRERLKTHNNLLTKWQDSTEKDRATFATKEALEALKGEFSTYRLTVARALDLAEGKAHGVQMVRTAVSFVAGLAVALITAYGFVHGVPR